MKQIEGSYRSGVGPQVLWAALSDPERLGEALPDVGLVEVHDAERFSASVRPSTNLGVTALALELRIAEQTEGERVRIVGDGSAGEHRVSFDVELRFAARDGGGSDVSWSAEVQAFGGLGSLTQRVLPMLLRDQVSIVLATAERQAGALA
jgi:carbon monoxide dehydrogenase subunit G